MDDRFMSLYLSFVPCRAILGNFGYTVRSRDFGVYEISKNDKIVCIVVRTGVIDCAIECLQTGAISERWQDG